MNPFKGRHFQRDIILWAVRWYCKYGISYRELQEMLAERGVNVDHSTIYRWVQRYAPEMEKRLRWYWRNPSDLCPWHMDETYVKVNGRWAYLYRAVDSRGRTVDFYLSSRRNSKAAYRFLGKILNNVKKWQIPRFINTDKAPAYGRALALLKREGRCPSDVEHRQIKYRNNVIECDHGKLKRIIGATLGFKSMKTAYATIKGIEVMRALRKGQASAFYYGDPPPKCEMRQKDIMISFDEWNVWYLRGDPWDAPMKHKENRFKVAPPLLEDRYSFLDALVVGGLLCSLINHCDRVKMASLAQLVNVIAPIFTEAGGGVIRQTIFWPFAMVANVAKGSALRHFIPAGTFSSKYGDARRIQSAVVHNAAAGKLYLFALNSDFHDSFTLDPDLSAFGQTRLAEHQILRCDDLYAKNTFDRPDRVAPETLTASDLTLPPLSWNRITFDIL